MEAVAAVARGGVVGLGKGREKARAAASVAPVVGTAAAASSPLQGQAGTEEEWMVASVAEVTAAGCWEAIVAGGKARGARAAARPAATMAE